MNRRMIFISLVLIVIQAGKISGADQFSQAKKELISYYNSIAGKSVDLNHLKNAEWISDNEDVNELLKFVKDMGDRSGSKQIDAFFLDDEDNEPVAYYHPEALIIIRKYYPDIILHQAPLAYVKPAKRF